MASASDLISRIDSVLDDLQFLAEVIGAEFVSVTKITIFLLRNYKIFLLTVTKMGDDPIVGPFLQVLQALVCQLEEFHAVRLVFSGQADPGQLDLHDLDIQDYVKSLWEQIGQLCDILLVPSRLSDTLTSVEVADMIASVMKNLFLFHSLEWDINVQILENLIKALEEQMLFLENLQLFASNTADSKADQHLLAHLEAVSIKATYLLLKCVHESETRESFSEDLLSAISKLIQYIKPTDPQVHQTYIDILRSSKPRRRLTAPADRDVDQEDYHAKGFLDSLRSNLLELLQLNTHGIVSVNDPPQDQDENYGKGFLDSLWPNLMQSMKLFSQGVASVYNQIRGAVSLNDHLRVLVSSMNDPLQELYQGLGSLIIILSHEPNTFDSSSKENIFDVVCDAGILICSLYQTHIQLDHDLHDLLEAIRLIQAEFGQTNAPEPLFNMIPTTAPLSFLDFLLEKLTELTSFEVETNTRSHAHAIKKELVILRSFLANIVELREEQDEFETLRDHIMELVYRAEHLIDYLVVGDVSDSFSLSFDSFMKDITDIHLEFDVQELEIKREGVKMIHHHMPSQRTLSFDNEVVGYLEEAESIKNRLTRGLNQLCIVAIVGMPGQGKTTLAAKVYNDPSVSLHFSVKARTVVSQTLDKRRVLLDLLDQIDPDKCSGIISDHDLVQKVWRSLKGRRYVIFLDDVWGAEAWRSLEEVFPDDHKASRIILTSRHHDVAPGEERHELRPFNEEESMDLLQRKLFSGSGWPVELADIGRELAQICKGLPLTILIVAGILSTIALEGWKKILGGLGSGLVSSTEQCRNTLELSYNHLPEHLRPCLLYLVTFTEDEEVPIRRLLSLWIAEGFVRKDGKQRVEDIAEDYLRDLIGRSLLMAAKEKSIGGVKSCRIHDLLHEFFLKKAKEERFLSFLRGNDEVLEFHEPHYLRRLCINIDPKHLIRSNNSISNVRSLSFNYCTQQILPNLSFMFQLCKLLRVLDLEQINSGSVFPSEIGLLVQLAFLAICGSMTDLPLSIGNLSNLECFILTQLRRDKMVALPESVWKFQKLRHLSMSRQGGIFPMENLYNSSDLCELDRLSGVAIHYPCDMEGLLKKFPNIRKLRCTISHSVSQNIHVKIVVPDFLRQLESLSLFLLHNGVTQSEFSLPANLKKLTLSGFPLSSWSLSSISKLPNLEVLKFESVSFEREIWEMGEEGFSKLRFLQLSSWNLISWRSCEDQFECLEKLVLVRCASLEEMPSCLEYSSTLEVIEVRYCPYSVHELVGKIKEVQEDNGNSELKIITHKSA